MLRKKKLCAPGTLISALVCSIMQTIVLTDICYDCGKMLLVATRTAISFLLVMLIHTEFCSVASTELCVHKCVPALLYRVSHYLSEAG